MAEVSEGGQVGVTVLGRGLGGKGHAAQHRPVVVAMQHMPRGELQMGDAQVVEVGHDCCQRSHPCGPLGRAGQGPGGPGVGADELGVEGSAPVRGLDDVDETHQSGVVQTLEQVSLPLDFARPFRGYLFDRDQAPL